MVKLDVNTDACIKLTAKLEKLSKSALPSAIRNTLNDVGFEHKRLIPIEAKNSFEYSRNKTFFRAVTNVEKASGFNVNTMKAVSGLNPNALGGKAKKVIDNLEAHENGGILKSRKLLNLNTSRVGSGKGGRVQSSARFEKTPFHDSTDAFKANLKKTGSKKSAFVVAILSANKSGKKNMLIKGGKKGKISGLVYSIGGGSINRKTKKFNVKTKKLFSYRENTAFKIRRTTFISNSNKVAARKIESFYQKQAEFQFKKYLK